MHGIEVVKKRKVYQVCPMWLNKYNNISSGQKKEVSVHHVHTKRDPCTIPAQPIFKKIATVPGMLTGVLGLLSDELAKVSPSWTFPQAFVKSMPLHNDNSLHTASKFMNMYKWKFIEAKLTSYVKHILHIPIVYCMLKKSIYLWEFHPIKWFFIEIW